MRRVPSILLLSFALLLGLLAAGLSPLARAQDDATPATGDAEEVVELPEEDVEFPEGVTFEALGYGTAENLPPTGDILLFRVRLEPGAVFPIDPDPAPGLVLVEDGGVTITVDGPVTVLRAAGEGTPFPTETEQVEADEEFTLEAGDSAAVQGGLTGEIVNEADGEAVLLVAIVTQVEGNGGATPEATPGEGGAVPAE